MEENHTPPPNKPPRRKRRWFQYSLRTLLILTALVAVWMAWWSHNARQQRDAVAALEKDNVIVHYVEDKNVLWPGWLVDLLGRDYFGTVRDVELYGKKLNARDIEHLKSLPSLETLNLTISPISDKDLEGLYGLSQLRELKLFYTQVTDAGVERLQKALPNCKIHHRRTED